LKLARTTSLSAAAAALLVGVPGALAVTLPGGARYAGQTANGSAVTLRLTADGQRVANMRIHYTLRCVDSDTGDKSTSKTYTDVLNAPVRPDGSFRGSGTYKGSRDQSTNKFKVSGTVSPRKGSGTFVLTEVGTSPQTNDTVRCRTGTLHWRVARAH
jgi:hypothetical protein